MNIMISMITMIIITQSLSQAPNQILTKLATKSIWECH